MSTPKSAGFIPFSWSSKSLRFQMLATAFTVLLAVSVVTLWAANRYAHHTAQLSYDRSLGGAAFQIIDNVRYINLSWIVDIPISAFKVLAQSPTDRVFYLVVNEDRKVITGYDDLMKQAEVVEHIDDYPDQLEPSALFFDMTYRGEPFRFTIVSNSINTPSGLKDVYVLVGQTLNSRNSLQDEITFQARNLVFLVILTSLTLTLLSTWKIIRPIRNINKKIAKRSNVDLTPISHQGPQEVDHLITTINRFMEQLDTTLRNLKNFTGEAAHQLKTPLSGLKAQAQLARDNAQDEETKSRLAHVLSACDHLDRTITQLLNQATITHRHRSLAPSAINLNDQVTTVCRDLAMNALSRGVELGYHESDTVLVNGDDFALSQMLQNLIENAIKYSPDNSAVDIQLSAEKENAVLLIQDHGNGISDEDKPHVFERFYRSPNNTSQGTGLGMAIALDVAKNFNASLTLEDNEPHGLRVKVVFPEGSWRHA
ncbi:Swarming motility regulation sensor protein RssA [Grimontia celer]|uniref:histidine kinase n=1 Tax=Grimontia celer TaxID=1796497 RepID=A0A128F1J3_9GAMM|nr:sensor histidine kinase [Grimontia celer]CZF80657.1 Swarming motility regulation sensor protein RssA [Grimontia celer]